MVKRRAWRCPRWECSRKGAGGWRVRLGVNASSYHTVLCMHLPISFRIYNGKGNENITLFGIDVLHVRVGFGTNDGSEENTACYREKDRVESIWDYISEPASYKKFSGVKEFTCEEKALNAKIELTGKDGKKRSQYISVIDYDVFKICYFVIRSDYTNDKQWVYAFEVHPKGDKKCEVVLSVYNGFDELSPEFKKGMSEEFDTIIANLQKKFK